MRSRLWVGTSLVFAGFLGLTTVLGCSLLKKKTDTSDAASDAPPPPPPVDSSAAVDASTAPTAVNAADIKRFPDETAMNSAPDVIRWSVADVRKSPGSYAAGSLVGTLKVNSSVSEIATEKVSGVLYALVMYPDPSDSTQELEGWINARVLGPQQIDAGVNKRRLCPAGQTAIATEDGTGDCQFLCSAAQPCPNGLACAGDGNLENIDGTPGAGVTFCAGNATTSAVDAGTAHPHGTLPTTTRALGMPPRCSNASYQMQGIVCRLKCQVDDDCDGTASSKCVASLCVP